MSSGMRNNARTETLMLSLHCCPRTELGQRVAVDGGTVVPAVSDPGAAKDAVHEGVQQKVDDEREPDERAGGAGRDVGGQGRAERGRDVHGQRRGRGHRDAGAQTRSARAHSPRQRFVR